MVSDTGRVAVDIETQDAVDFLQRRGHVVILNSKRLGMTPWVWASRPDLPPQPKTKRITTASFAGLEERLSRLQAVPDYPWDHSVVPPDGYGYGYPWDRAVPPKAAWFIGSVSWSYADSRWEHALRQPYHPYAVAARDYIVSWPRPAGRATWARNLTAVQLTHWCRLICGTLHIRRDDQPLAGAVWRDFLTVATAAARQTWCWRRDAGKPGRLDPHSYLLPHLPHYLP